MLPLQAMPSSLAEDEIVVLAQLGSPYGLKGEVKLYSYTQPMAKISEYPDLLIQLDNKWQSLQNYSIRTHGQSLLFKFGSCNSPEAARSFVNAPIGLPKSKLPSLDQGEYYWCELIGCEVINLQQISFGKLQSMLATGSNDVMVVKGSQERLIPYIQDLYVKSVDLDNKRILVDWDAEF